MNEMWAILANAASGAADTGKSVATTTSTSSSDTASAWIALVGTLFGGAGLKAVEYLLSRKHNKADNTEATIREELRRELADARHESDENRDEADKWRDRYYSVVSFVSSGDVPNALRRIEEYKD